MGGCLTTTSPVSIHPENPTQVSSALSSLLLEYLRFQEANLLIQEYAYTPFETLSAFDSSSCNHKGVVQSRCCFGETREHKSVQSGVHSILSVQTALECEVHDFELVLNFITQCKPQLGYLTAENDFIDVWEGKWSSFRGSDQLQQWKMGGMRRLYGDPLRSVLEQTSEGSLMLHLPSMTPLEQSQCTYTITHYSLTVMMHSKCTCQDLNGLFY